MKVMSGLLTHGSTSRYLKLFYIIIDHPFIRCAIELQDVNSISAFSSIYELSIASNRAFRFSAASHTAPAPGM